MTAERNGAESTPEGDDPFAHLYRREGGDGSPPPPASQQPGVPRRSYNQVRNVGERQYGQSQGGYNRQQPSAHYAAPETMPGGRPAPPRARRAAPVSDRGSRGPSRNGLLAGALAVVAAVVIGIGAAVVFNTDDSEAAGSAQGGAGNSASGRADEGKPEGGDAEGQKEAEQLRLPKEDAASLRLDGGTVTAAEIPEAQAKGGTYVTGLNKVGAKVTWNVEAPKAGKYRLYVRYGIPGEDANATLAVNGEANTQPLNMKNFIGSPKGDWAKGWQSTWAPVTLTKGDNVVAIACAEGNQCNANLDKVWLQRAK